MTLTPSQLSEIEHAVANGIDHDAVRHRRELLNHVRSTNMTQNEPKRIIQNLNCRLSDVNRELDRAGIAARDNPDETYLRVWRLRRERDAAEARCERLLKILAIIERSCEPLKAGEGQ